MSDWPEKIIKESSYLKGRIGWQGLRAAEFIEEGPYLITGTNFRSGRIDWDSCYHVSESRFNEAPNIHIKNDDVLITKDGTIGKVAYVNDSPEKAVLNSGIFLLRCKDGSYKHKFVYHVLNSEIFIKFLRNHLNGSTINHLYQHVFEKFSIPLPPIKVQKKITDTLDCIDANIEKTEALIQKYHQIKTGLMHNLFTRGVLPDGRLRPPREEAPELYKETPIGWIPKEWDFTLCNCLCDKIIDCKNRTPAIKPEGYPVIRTPNVRNGKFVDQDLVYTDYESYLIWTQRGEPKVGDIVITREAPVGEVCMIPERHPKACLGQRMMLYRPDENQIDPKFFLFALQSSPIQKRLDLISGGSTVGHVRVGDIRDLFIFRPKSFKEQRRIGCLLTAIENRIDRENGLLEKLRNQKSGLMQDLLTGRVRVPVDEKEAAHV